MDKNKILQEMRDAVGKEAPVDFFKRFVDLFGELFSKIEKLEAELKDTKRNSALSIQWEPKIASDMITAQIEVLRKDKDTYAAEITALKTAYAAGAVVKRYDVFCQFWQDTLGYHPFLEY